MKTLILIGLALGLSGCAMLNEINKNTHERSAQRRAKQEKIASDLADQESTWAIGATLDKFNEAWGKPTGILTEGDQTILFHDTTEGSYKFSFKNGVLKGWVPDNERNSANKRDAEFEEAREAMARQERAAAWQNMGNTLNQMNTQNKLNQIESNQRRSDFNNRQNQIDNSGRVLVNQPR